MAAYTVINFIFAVAASQTVPLLEMGLFVITRRKKFFPWNPMGAVGPYNLVHSNGVRYGSVFTEMIWLFLKATVCQVQTGDCA